MDKLVLAKVIAVSALAGVGLAAPAAVWVVNNTPGLQAEQLTQARAFGAGSELAMRPATPKMTVVMLAPTVITASVEQSPAAESGTELGAADVLSPEKKRTCRDQPSETFAAGEIRVCDVDRTAVERGSGVFGAIIKPTQLAPRDLPSPSGLLQRR